MSQWEEDNEQEHDVAVVPETQKKVKKPPLYKVLLHNDNFTTMEFVVEVLQTIFHKSELDAVHIMLAVHHQGVGVAGVYTYEIAEAKVNKVSQLAQANEFPLLCTLEEE
ncbi:MAG: ATP-dependent Clp protease adapter ClpS [Candidatus Poribacteria bacterium]|nr:ATP-dependent Clp protease adapter ClpS [Candidatus Poribacteria bacterium]